MNTNGLITLAVSGTGTETGTKTMGDNRCQPRSLLRCSVKGSTGWPRHRENREFGSYYFQTGNTQGILLEHGKFWRHRENILTVIINIRSKLLLNFTNFFALLPSPLQLALRYY